MIKWAIELSKFDIWYKLQGLMKGHTLVDFVAELAHIPTLAPQANSKWNFSIDGASNLKGNRASIILEGLNEVLFEQSLGFSFKASNNQAEYEASIAGMLLAQEMGVCHLIVKSDM